MHAQRQRAVEVRQWSRTGPVKTQLEIARPTSECDGIRNLVSRIIEGCEQSQSEYVALIRDDEFACGLGIIRACEMLAAEPRLGFVSAPRFLWWNTRHDGVLSLSRFRVEGSFGTLTWHQQQRSVHSLKFTSLWSVARRTQLIQVLRHSLRLRDEVMASLWEPLVRVLSIGHFEKAAAQIIPMAVGVARRPRASSSYQGQSGASKALTRLEVLSHLETLLLDFGLKGSHSKLWATELADRYVSTLSRAPYSSPSPLKQKYLRVSDRLEQLMRAEVLWWQDHVPAMITNHPIQTCLAAPSTEHIMRQLWDYRRRITVNTARRILVKDSSLDLMNDIEAALSEFRKSIQRP
jgi:hypothetical protein